MTFIDVQPDKKTAFDEVLTAELTPVVAIQFPYNINTKIIDKRENNLGSVTQADGMAVLQSGAAANSAAHMLTRTPVKYDPGIGAAVRFTALFTTGVANSVQVAGIGEVGDGLFFGFNGAEFSILRRELGKPEVQTLTITTGAVSDSGNITINLDGVSKVVAVLSGDTAREVAVKIADADFSDTGLGWTEDINNATVIFRAWSDGNKAGAFTLVDTDTTGVVGTFDETIAGVSTTNEWIAQTDWNADVMDGTGKSGMTLDPTKGNVYQIQYQWLGYGQLNFHIENENTGELIFVHRIKYTNTTIIPSLQNPTLPLHIMSKNIANTSNLTIKTGSMGGFVEGKKLVNGLHHSVEQTLTSIGTTELPVISIKNKVVYQGTINRVRSQIGFLSVSSDGTKSVIIRLRKNVTLTGPVAFADHEVDVSPIAIDTASTGLTLTANTDTAFSTVLGKVQSEFLDLHQLSTILNPGDIYTVTAEMVSGSGQEVACSVIWVDAF